MKHIIRAISLTAALFFFFAACQSAMCQHQETSAAIPIPSDQLTAALEKVQQISNTLGKTKAYEFIAEVQVTVGDLAGACKTLDKAKEAAALIRDDETKALTYRAIAEAQAKAGNAVGAKETAALIDKREHRAIAYGNIAWKQAKRGDLTGAIESIAKSVEAE